MTARASLIAKIKALLAKTVANGCTEAEAMSALAMAQRMMAEHDIAQADMTEEAEGVTAAHVVKTDHDKIRDRLFQAVARFCRCREWRSGFDGITFCGLESETVFAHWLLDMLADFVMRAASDWRACVHTRRDRAAFVVGCCDRISERLIALASQPAGRGIVVSRDALIKSFMDRNGISLTRGRGEFRLLDPAAYAAGCDAGEAAQFNRPVEQRAPAARIGGR